MDKGIQKLIEDFKLLLMQKFGSRVHKVLLFGSQADGTAGTYSDIDVAVVLSGDVPWQTKQKIYDLAFDAEGISGKLLNVTVLNKTEYEGRPIELLLLLENIKEHGITV